MGPVEPDDGCDELIVLLKVSQIGVTLGDRIAEIDINPFIVLPAVKVKALTQG